MHIDGGECCMTRRRVRGRLGSSIQAWLWWPPARCQLPYGNLLMWWEWSGSIRSTRQSFHRNFVEMGSIWLEMGNNDWQYLPVIGIIYHIIL